MRLILVCGEQQSVCVYVSLTLRFIVRRPDLHVHSLEGVPPVPERSPVDAVLEHSVITCGGRELVRPPEEARRRTGISAVATGGDVPVRRYVSISCMALESFRDQYTINPQSPCRAVLAHHPGDLPP